MLDSSSAANMPPLRTASWKWWVCGLLLLATMINYMDRLTLNQTSKRVMTELQLGEPGYGELESAFAYAFALGAIISGWMADRFNVRWLYAVLLVAWSAAGFATGLVEGFAGLLACRFLLGLAEAGHLAFYGEHFQEPGTGYRRVLFEGKDGKRKTIRLGKVPLRFAQEVKAKVEAIILAGDALDAETAAWLARLAIPFTPG